MDGSADQVFEIGAASDADAFITGLADKQLRPVNVRLVAANGQRPDHRNLPVIANRLNGLLQRPRSSDFDYALHALAARQVFHSARPFRRLSHINDMLGTKLFQLVRLVRACRCHDDARAAQPGDLDGEQRDAARPLS